jgi:hypothetical protein
VPLEAPDYVTKRGDETGVDRQDDQGLDRQSKGPDYIIALRGGSEEPQVNVLGYELGVDNDREEKEEAHIDEDVEKIALKVLAMVHVLPDNVTLRWC